MLKNHANNYSRIYILVIIVLTIKLILLPYSQTVNADAVSRIFNSISWMEKPPWIKTSIWAPFHFYINGIGLFIWNDRVITPKVINILFSSFTLIPFYLFTKREFNKNGALVATIFLLYPLFYSAIALWLFQKLHTYFSWQCLLTYYPKQLEKI